MLHTFLIHGVSTKKGGERKKPILNNASKIKIKDNVGLGVIDHRT